MYTEVHMDIVSHGLWGGIAFGRKSKKTFLQSFFFGISPDLFSFGVFFVLNILGVHPRPDFSNGLPSPSVIPEYIHSLYDFTHSLIVFGVVFGLVWLFRKKPFLPLAAWGLHILIDIPTHSFDFFPTPFLWPISDFGVDGISWGTPIIWYSNFGLLILLYAITIIKLIKEKRGSR